MSKALKKRRIISALLILCLSIGAVALFGCESELIDDERITVLCTVFPEYDWARNIVGDSESISVSLLIKNGQELHGYDASIEDRARICKSDVVISVGGVSDEWIRDALKTDGEKTEHIQLSQIEGMTLYDVSSESAGHKHDESCEHDHHRGEGDIDEHLWLSLKNAAIACEYICQRLSALDPDGAEIYRKNTDSYKAELAALDARMERIEQEEPVMLFADRFPFVYFLEDYGIDYYAAFEGCSTDINWTPDTTVKLANMLDASTKKYLFVTETSDGELARLVINSSKDGGEVVTLDSMQRVGVGTIETESYLRIMAENIAELERIFLGQSE